MADLICASCGRRGPRGGEEWYEGSERDVMLDPDEIAVEEGAFLCGLCVRRIDREERPRWKPLKRTTAGYEIGDAR